MSLTRLVVLRAPLTGVAEPDETRLAKKLVREINGAATEDLASVVDRLQRKLGYKLRRVAFFVRKVDSEVGSIDESLDELGQVLPEVRIHISFYPLRRSASASLRHDYEISHLVETERTTSVAGWQRGAGVSSALLFTPYEKWSHLIQDVGLDIVMFHSTRSVVKRFGGTHASKLEYSRLKAQFAKDAAGSGQSTYYGPITSESIDYLPLASLCRSAAGVDINRFVSLWEAFIEYLETAPPSPPSSVGGLIEEVIHHHQKGPQISERKLRHLITTTLKKHGPGRYYLVRAESRPKRPPLNGQMHGIFGSWRTGKLRVIEQRHIQDLRQFIPYISIYPLYLDTLSERG